jgi:hypothetical protein
MCGGTRESSRSDLLPRQPLEPDGTEMALHEYSVSARADAASLTSPTCRLMHVLPFLGAVRRARGAPARSAVVSFRTDVQTRPPSCRPAPSTTCCAAWPMLALLRDHMNDESPVMIGRQFRPFVERLQADRGRRCRWPRAAAPRRCRASPACRRADGDRG